MQLYRFHRYAVLALLLTNSVFFGITFFPTILFLKNLLNTNSFSQSLGIIEPTLWLALFDASPLTTLYTVLISILTGINITLIIFYYKTRMMLPRRNGTIAMTGTFLLFLGFGCASCGTFIISILLASVGISATIVPINGFLLQIAGGVLQIISIGLIIRQIQKPNVC